jgi:hypothetical protein
MGIRGISGNRPSTVIIDDIMDATRYVPIDDYLEDIPEQLSLLEYHDKTLALEALICNEEIPNQYINWNIGSMWGTQVLRPNRFGIMETITERLTAIPHLSNIPKHLLYTSQLSLDLKVIPTFKESFQAYTSFYLKKMKKHLY